MNTNTKMWYTSKTLWVNVISFVALLVQSKYGYVVTPAIQAQCLIAINIILRAITKTNVTFTNDTSDNIPN